MYIPKLLPTTGLAVTAIALTAVARPPVLQGTIDSTPPTNTILGKAMIDEGIRELDIKPSTIQSLKKKTRRNGVLELKAFPLPDGSTVDLELREYNLIAPGAQIVYQASTDPASARTEPLVIPKDMLVLTGRVAGEADSLAMLALSSKGSSGMIQYSKGTSILSSGKPGERNIPVIYDPSKALGGILQMADWSCNVDPGERVFEAPPLDHDHDRVHAGGLASVGTCTVLDLALEYDFEMWNDALNADSWSVLFYTIALLALVDEIYRRDTGIGINPSHIRVWTTADDPWNETSAEQQKNQLRSWYQTDGGDVPRDAVILCSARSLGGGSAFVGGLCNGFGYGVAGNMVGSFVYPLTDFDPSNWDIMTVTHELAHIMGAIHTRDFCPPLTQCAPFALFGECQTEIICGEGTIMSHCHSCSGGFSNIRMRFHPAVVDLITNHVATAPCLSAPASSVTADNDSAETLMNTHVYIDALLNDAGVCTLADYWSWDETSTAGGSVVLSSGTGPYDRDQLSYQPATGFVGEDTFGYVATDGLGGFASATVTIDVLPQVDSQDLLVIDPVSNIVQRFKWDTGEFLGTLVPPNEGGTDFAYAASHGPDGELLVTSFNNDQTLRFDSTSGVSAGVFSEEDIIRRPNDVVYDGENAYVSGQDSDRVIVYDADGIIVTVYPMLDDPNDILLEANRERVLVAWGSDGSVGGVQYWSTKTHQFLDSFDTPELTYTTSVSRLPNGDLVVGDTTGAKIGLYDGQTYAFLGFFLDSTDASLHGIGSPKRIERGPDDNMYVTSTTGLHRFAPDGSYLGILESTADPLLSSPHGLYFRIGLRVAGDANGDGQVDGTDLAVVLGNWRGSGAGDLNRDGVVNGTDIAIVLGNWS